MNKTSIIISITVLLLATACTPHQNYDSRQKAILEELTARHPSLTDFIFTDYIITDSISLGQAIDNCIELHKTKAESSEQMAERFRKAHKRKNAARCDSIRQTAVNVCHRLETLKSSMNSSLDSTLYYCIRFSGKSFAKNDNFQVDNYFITIDTNNKIHNMQNNANRLHSGMGQLIPEYKDILQTTNNERI